MIVYGIKDDPKTKNKQTLTASSWGDNGKFYYISCHGAPEDFENRGDEARKECSNRLREAMRKDGTTEKLLS